MDFARNERGFCVCFAWNLILFSFVREREGYKHHADCTVHATSAARPLRVEIVWNDIKPYIQTGKYIDVVYALNNFSRRLTLKTTWCYIMARSSIDAPHAKRCLSVLILFAITSAFIMVSNHILA